MRLKIKILSGFLILAIMLAVAGALSIYELTSIGFSVQRLLDENYKSINAAKMMIEALEREDSGVLLLLSGKWDEGRSTITRADESFQQGFKIAENNLTIAGEKTYVEAIFTTYSAYKDLWRKPIVGTQKENNLDWYFQEVHGAFEAAKTAVEKLMYLNDQTMYQTASDLKDRTRRAIMPGIVAILSALVFTLIFNYLINYYIVGPIIRITNEIQRFLESKDHLNLKIETKDELFDLANSIRQLSLRAGRDQQ